MMTPSLRPQPHAALVLFLIKKGKIADTNTNNIPDVVEAKVETLKEVVANVKEEVKKVKKPAAKNPAAKKPVASTGAKKIIKKEK
jgi:hypothetical protein